MQCTIIPALNTLVEQQARLTKNTEAEITHFLDYTATNLSAIIQYTASDMILQIDSNASYLSEPRVYSRTGGHYYLNSLPTNPKNLRNSRHQQMSQSTRNSESSSICGVRGWIRSRRAVPQWSNIGTPKNYTPWTQFYPTNNHNKNRQLRFQRNPHRYIETKKVQHNGHAILLDEGLGITKRLFSLWEIKKPKHGRLFHKTSPTTEICATYLYMENALLKIYHKIMHKLANAVLTRIHTVAVTRIHTVAITGKRTVLQGCVNVLCTYGHTNTKKVT